MSRRKQLQISKNALHLFSRAKFKFIWMGIAQSFARFHRNLNPTGRCKPHDVLGILSYAVLTVIWGLPVALLQRLLRPWLHIRTGWFSQGSRLGHLVLESDLYMAERGSSPRGKVDLFGVAGRPANSFFFKLLKEELRFLPKFITYPVHAANYVLPDGNTYRVPLAGRPTDLRILNDVPAFLAVGQDLQTRMIGSQVLSDLKIPENARIVCLANRDGAFGRHIAARDRQDFANYRDSSISSYVRAAEMLAQRGYWIIRMGREVEEEFQSSHNRIIDYATSDYKSDFADIFLSQRCNFAISSDTGASTLPIFFRKPLAIANLGGFTGLLQGKALSVLQFKGFFSEPYSRLLSLRELIAAGAMEFDDQSQFDALGITHIDNTDVDLLDLAKDICDVAEGRWSSSRAYVEAKERFDASVEPFRPGGISAHLCRGWTLRNGYFFS